MALKELALNGFSTLLVTSVTLPSAGSLVRPPNHSEHTCFCYP